jgi:hypothetical protein
MPISDAAIKEVMKTLGGEAAGDVDYCFQEWESAVSDAILLLPEPKDECAFLDWGVSFIGNLAWAATVFFPPAVTIKAISSVGKVAVSSVSDEPSLRRRDFVGAAFCLPGGGWGSAGRAEAARGRAQNLGFIRGIPVQAT